MWSSALMCLAALAGGDPSEHSTMARSGVLPAVADVAARIDELAERQWQAAGVYPAPPVDDAGFLRRVTLDLAGRVPTYREAFDFSQDQAADKRQLAIARLLDGPDFALHFGNVLDEIIQGRHAGDREFVAWLRRAIEARTSWDALFSEIMLGPWETPEQQPGARFLSRRVNSVDEMTNDAARVFFGVNISCAKCHDHPLVEDWKQDHYYGLVSFFSRTHAVRDREPPLLGEKDAGEVTFVDTDGNNHSARLMFLGGQVIDDPKLGLDPRLQDRRQAAEQQKQYLPPAFSLREALVRVALEDRTFFARAITNRIWAYLMGRGLVHPVDQMHSQNPASIPGLIEFLADDLAEHNYDLDRLAAAIVSSRAYQLSSEWPSAAEAPSAEHFARAALRPLTPQQFAFSVVLLAGDGSFDQSGEPDARRQRYQDLENQSHGLTEWLDQRTDAFQSSLSEALFVSNDPRMQQLTSPAGQNLVARLVEIADAEQLVETAVWTVLSRAPEADERAELANWINRPGVDRKAACGQLVWALFASAEFRFNH